MQAIQTHNLWTSLNSLRKSCMISGGRRYKHTTCEPHSTVSERAVWSVEADDTNIQLVNLTQQSQKEVYDQWRQTIQTYNLWTSLNSLRKSCMISGGRRHKHTTCKPHSTVSGRAVWSVEADDTNIQLVNLTLQSQTELYDQWRQTIQTYNLWTSLNSLRQELYDQWRQTIQTYNLWTSLNSLRQSCMISGGRRYKHTTCKPHSTVSGRAVWSVEADDTNIQLVNLTQQSQSCMISGGRRYKHTTCEPHSTVSERAVWSVEADDTNIQLVNLTLQSQKELYDQWRQTIQTYNLWTSLYSLRQSCMISGGRRYKHTTCEPHSTVSDKSCMISGGRRYKHTTCEPHSTVSERAVWSVEADDTNTLVKLVNLTLQSQSQQSCMISGGRRYKHITCEPHSTVSDRAVWSVEADDTNIQLVNLTLQSQSRAVWSVEADDTNIQLVNLTLQSQTELYDQWRQTIQTYNLWTSLNSLRKSCMISGGRRYKHTTCEPHSTVSGRAVWSVEADDTNIQLVEADEPHSTVSGRAVWSVEANDTNIQLVNLTLQSQTELYDQWRQTIQTYNLWTSLCSLRQSCMISGGRRYKHTTCEPHSTVRKSCMISGGRRYKHTLVNLTQQSQKELYDQWRQTIQTYNLWTSLNSLWKSCMISGGRRYKHTTCEPHSTVSERAVWSVEADDTNTQLVNLTLQSQTELYDQWRQTIQTHNLWTSLNSLRKSCMISGGRRYKHTTCEPHSTVSERAVWSVEADDTNIQLVNLTQQSQKELYDQWRQTIQTYNLWTSLNSLRKSCMISGGRRHKHTTCKPHSTVSGRAVWSVEADDTNIQLVNLTQQSQKELYDQWRQTIQTYNLWTSLNSLRQSCMISGGRRHKHTTCKPHSTVSGRAVWSVEADDTNIQLVNLTLQSQAELYDQWRQTIQTHNLWTSLCSLRQELYDQWRQTIQTYNLWTSLNSLRKSCMISGGRRYKHTTCEPHSTVSERAVWSVEADDTNTQLVNLTLPSQTELYDQWRQTIQTHNLWTSLYSLRQSCMISGGRRYKHTTCEPHSTVSDRARAVWSVEADDTNIQLVNLTLQSQKELYDQWRQTIQTYNLWTSLNSLRKSCMISGGRRHKHTTCKPHSTVSGRFTSCMFVSSASTDHRALPETVEWGLQVVCLCRLPPLIIQLFLRLLSEVHKLYVCIVCLHWSYSFVWDCRVRFTSCMFVSSASTDHTALSETVEWGSQVVCLYRLPHWSYSSAWDCRVRFTSYVFVSSASTDHTALALSETVEWGSQVVCLYRLPPLIIQLCLRL